MMSDSEGSICPRSGNVDEEGELPHELNFSSISPQIMDLVPTHGSRFYYSSQSYNDTLFHGMVTILLINKLFKLYLEFPYQNEESWLW